MLSVSAHRWQHRVSEAVSSQATLATFGLSFDEINAVRDGESLAAADVVQASDELACCLMSNEREVIVHRPRRQGIYEVESRNPGS